MTCGACTDCKCIFPLSSLYCRLFWRFLLPCLISLLLTIKVCALPVLFLLAPLVVLLALFGNGAELRVQLELAL